MAAIARFPAEAYKQNPIGDGASQTQGVRAGMWSTAGVRYKTIYADHITWIITEPEGLGALINVHSHPPPPPPLPSPTDQEDHAPPPLLPPLPPLPHPHSTFDYYGPQPLNPIFPPKSFLFLDFLFLINS
ncbi:hypothetical protein DM860_014312 [Cuscuta australis]|uniref:Uncharacterized protein n=1 Tax=Cuscuta australis TaxID=267555 RepID=A0A328DI45_9ASTE|nr:hypothetical protein DM860_014312 [Cuscuta australis]